MVEGGSLSFLFQGIKTQWEFQASGVCLVTNQSFFSSRGSFPLQRSGDFLTSQELQLLLRRTVSRRILQLLPCCCSKTFTSDSGLCEWSSCYEMLSSKVSHLPGCDKCCCPVWSVSQSWKLCFLVVKMLLLFSCHVTYHSFLLCL